MNFIFPNFSPKFKPQMMTRVFFDVCAVRLNRNGCVHVVVCVIIGEAK